MEYQNSEKQELKIAQELEQLNLIYAPFQLSDDDLLRWSKHIVKNMKKEEIEKIEQVVSKFTTGKFLYDKNLGVANIFLGVKKLIPPMPH